MPQSSIHLLTRRRLLAGMGALGAAGLLRLDRAWAQPLSGGAIQVGALKVTPLLDGMFQLPLDVIPDAASPAGAPLIRSMGAPEGGPLPIPVNAFAVEKAGRLFLIDAGTGAAGGPDLGKVAQALTAAGLDRNRVEAVILTHLHVDHAAGAIDGAGKPVFPNAELVLQHSEIEFWMDDGIRSRAPQGMDGYFGAARAVLAAYPKRVRAVEGETDLFPGIRGVPEPGHTPGHMGVLLEDGTNSLLMWGDVMHVGPLQLAHPEWSVMFDVNRTQAAETRARMLNRLAVDRIPVMGSHLANRGVIEHDGAGYRMVDAS